MVNIGNIYFLVYRYYMILIPMSIDTEEAGPGPRGS